MSNFYNEEIEINKSELPKSVVEIIEELEKWDEANDWLWYSTRIDVLEMELKNLVEERLLEASIFKKLMKKYGGWD